MALVLLCALAALGRPGTARAEGITPTCDAAPGVLQIVGLTLTYTAGAGDANTVTVVHTGGTYTPLNTDGIPLTQATYQITDHGAGGFNVIETSCASDPGATCTTDPIDAAVVTCTAIIEEIDVFTGDQDDQVDVSGVPAPTFIGGGGGNDILRGGANDDSIAGGDQNDVIRGGPGADNLHGGNGADTADYSARTNPVTVDFTLTSGQGEAGENDRLTAFESADGGSGNDRLLGDDAENFFDGHGGDDVLNGGGGDDYLQGGDGDDFLIDTNETVSGRDDIFEGEAGRDRLIGGTGNNMLFGQDGNDWLSSGCAAIFGEGSTLDGGDGDDTLSAPASCSAFPAQGRDALTGGPGEDTADYCAEDNPRSVSIPLGYRPLPARDWLNCGRTANQRVVVGGTGNGFAGEQDTVDTESVIGGAGDDVLQGDEFFSAPPSPRAWVNGATGSDTLRSTTFVALIGGPGGPNDTGDDMGGAFTLCPSTSRGYVDYSLRTSPVTVSLDGVANDGEPGEGDNDRAWSAFGGRAGDVLIGRDPALDPPPTACVRPGQSLLVGNEGDDKLYGKGGPDDLFGGPDDDYIEGGPGADVMQGESGSDEIRSRDGIAEAPDCGTGVDSAFVDRVDSPSNCEVVHVGVGANLGAGGSLSSDVEGDGATPGHPVEVQLTTPNAGDVELEERATTTPSPTGYQLLGTEYKITAPAGTADFPLIIYFRIDASQVPAGQGPDDIVIYRNGVPIPDCNPAPPRMPGTADPDPCVAGRVTLPDGDIQILVLTSSASIWNMAFDVTPPAISLVTPPAGATYLLYQVVLAGYTCADDGSGVDTCVGTVASGAAVNTGSVGGKTFGVNASDKSGNLSSSTHNYRVIYDFSGFFSPLENPGHLDGLLNSVKAGSAVPVKFRLAGDQGLAIFDVGSPQSKRISCDGGATTDPVEETVTANASGLKYDLGTQTYSYVWKTDKLWAGTCRQLNVRLDDGTDHLVNFKFTK